MLLALPLTHTYCPLLLRHTVARSSLPTLCQQRGGHVFPLTAAASPRALPPAHTTARRSVHCTRPLSASTRVLHRRYAARVFSPASNLRASPVLVPLVRRATMSLLSSFRQRFENHIDFPGAQLAQAILGGSVVAAHRLIVARSDLDSPLPMANVPPLILVLLARSQFADKMKVDSTKVTGSVAMELLLDLIHHGASAKVRLGHWTGLNLCAANVKDRRFALDAARLLLDNGAPVDEIDYRGFTPLMNAASAGNLELVRLLIQRGAHIEGEVPETALDVLPPDVRERVARPTPLGVAAVNGKDDVVRFLLNAGAQVNRCDANGVSALEMACIGNHAETARLLLGAGADPKLRNKLGVTAFGAAMLRDAHEAALALVPYGADVLEPLGENGEPAFIMLVRARKSWCVAAILLHGGARLERFLPQVMPTIRMLLRNSKSEDDDALLRMIEWYNTQLETFHTFHPPAVAAAPTPAGAP